MKRAPSRLPPNPDAAVIMPGSGSRVSMRGGIGRTLQISPEPVWKHPWQITLLWDGTRQLWTSTMKAGFVNGECPVVISTAGSAANPANWQEFGINPLDGQPFFSAWVFNRNTPAIPAETTVWLPLYSNPLIDLSWFNIGFDDLTAQNPVPQFFQNLGVTPATPVDPDDPDQSASSLFTPPPAGNRLLRGCNLILHQPHVALTSQITLEPGIATGESNVSQTLGLTQISPGDTLKVYAQGGAFSPQDAIAAGIDPSTGDYTEPTYDEILIGTAYLLSPPNTAPYSAPDQTWQPFVRHSLFWNLFWAQPEFQPTPTEATDAFGQLAQLTSVLGAGSGSVEVNYLTASLNDAYQAATNILAAQSMAGFFWTPTGGGSTSLFPPPPPMPVTAPSGRGADKSGLIAAQTAAAARALASQRLDPDFPFTASQFNTALLS
jgi:hypothetical protein